MSTPGRLIILSGPSGVGKTTVWGELESLDPRYVRSVSCTTRPPRPGERDGVDYHFLSLEEFDRRVVREEFAEWKPYNHHRYGTLKSALDNALVQGRWLGLVIEVQGAAELRRQYPEALAIFALPPSRFDLERRLAGRGDLKPAEIEARMSIARREMACLSDYDFYVINDTPAECALRIHRWVGFPVR